MSALVKLLVNAGVCLRETNQFMELQLAEKEAQVAGCGTEPSLKFSVCSHREQRQRPSVIFDTSSYLAT